MLPRTTVPNCTSLAGPLAGWTSSEMAICSPTPLALPSVLEANVKASTLAVTSVPAPSTSSNRTEPLASCWLSRSTAVSCPIVRSFTKVDAS